MCVFHDTLSEWGPAMPWFHPLTAPTKSESRCRNLSWRTRASSRRSGRGTPTLRRARCYPPAFPQTSSAPPPAASPSSPPPPSTKWPWPRSRDVWVPPSVWTPPSSAGFSGEPSLKMGERFCGTNWRRSGWVSPRAGGRRPMWPCWQVWSKVRFQINQDLGRKLSAWIPDMDLSTLTLSELMIKNMFVLNWPCLCSITPRRMMSNGVVWPIQSPDFTVIWSPNLE